MAATLAGNVLDNNAAVGGTAGADSNLICTGSSRQGADTQQVARRAITDTDTAVAGINIEYVSAGGILDLEGRRGVNGGLKGRYTVNCQAAGAISGGGCGAITRPSGIF